MCLKRGDQLPAKVAEKIVTALANEIPARLPVERLTDLLTSNSAVARAIALHTAFMCGPAARPLISEIRELLDDGDSEVRLWARRCFDQLDRN